MKNGAVPSKRCVSRFFFLCCSRNFSKDGAFQKNPKRRIALLFASSFGTRRTILQEPLFVSKEAKRRCVSKKNKVLFFVSRRGAVLLASRRTPKEEPLCYSRSFSKDGVFQKNPKRRTASSLKHTEEEAARVFLSVVSLGQVLLCFAFSETRCVSERSALKENGVFQNRFFFFCCYVVLRSRRNTKQKEPTNNVVQKI